MAQAPDSDRDLHRPADWQTLRAAAAELRQRGLTPRDIAPALSLTEAAVRQLLGGPEAAAPQLPSCSAPLATAAVAASGPISPRRPLFGPQR